jgi:myosin heavy subunit
LIGKTFIFKGNLTFTDIDGEDCLITEGNEQLEWISTLFQCKSSELSSALTSRVVSARNEVFQTKQTITRAYYARDALSKVSNLIISKAN